MPVFRIRLWPMLGTGLLLARFASAQEVSTADRARQAIGQRFQEISAEKLDARGYVARPEQNLVPGVRLEDFRADLEQGSGDELAGKFCAAHSSSALAVNTFGPWRQDPQSLRLLGQTGFTALQFERKCPTGLPGIPPNLDLLLESPGAVIGVESKFLEILKPKQPRFNDSYRPENLPQLEPCWAQLMESLQTGPKQYLDAAQLVRHYLGLRKRPEFKGRKIYLLYLFWEPENWSEFPEYRQHRIELAAFQARIRDSEVTFAWRPYSELWNQWRKLGLRPGHIQTLQQRYILKIQAT